MHTYQLQPELGYEVVGLVGDSQPNWSGAVDVLGPISDLSRVVREAEAVGVVVSLPSVACRARSTD